MDRKEGTHYNNGNLKRQSNLMVALDRLIDKKCSETKMRRKDFFQNCGVNYSTYRNYRCGTAIPFFTVAVLADALGVSMDELYRNCESCPHLDSKSQYN